jgi:DNA-binding FadR family transcriptional regulator
MPQTIKNAVYHHNKILNAIELHDPIVAKKQMEAHIKSLIRRINKSRESQGTSVTNKEDERRSSYT